MTIFRTMKTVEQVFKTEGVPPYTFVKPPNYTEILIDIRAPGKPVIVEGQSGTGKTTTVKQILRELKSDVGITYWTIRDGKDRVMVEAFAQSPRPGVFIIDDFHRLAEEYQQMIANLVKAAAETEEPERFPKVIVLGINRVGSVLIQQVHDIGKRLGVHRIKPGSRELVDELLQKGERELGVELQNKTAIYDESRGDYWLTQMIARTICSMNGVTEEQQSHRSLTFAIPHLRERLTEKLQSSYDEPIKTFCRGNRFRPTNDPYYKLLVAVSAQDSSIVDLVELANANISVRGSINNIKDNRLPLLLSEKELCARYFFYNPTNACLAIEDPALFYYIRIVDWERIKRECGFRSLSREYEWDFAISFAGENRELAREIVYQLELLDASVFFDEHYEANFLGRVWREQFRRIFTERSRFVVCLLDVHHDRKIWPTFERECFAPRVKDGEVIPIYLDDTLFPGISRDLVGIEFKKQSPLDSNLVTDNIVWKLMERLSSP
jgi:hypothetical protein